jgi:HlyD family secretion protein
MRMPRVRFTIGRLMVGVLVLSLSLWGVMFYLQVSDERRAEAAYKRAVLVLEIAEDALKEYVEEASAREIAVLNGQIELARSDRERAVDRLEWSRKRFARGFLGTRVPIVDQLALDRSTFALEQAETKLDVLRKYTIEKHTKELMSGVEKARMVVKVRRGQYETERAKRKRMLGF